MHRPPVHAEHLSCIHLAANPITSQRSSLWNFWNMEVRRIVTLNAEAMGAFQNLQWALICWAIVKRNPDGKALGISIHESIVLMRVIHETFAIRKNQSADRFGMNQKPLAHEHAHDLFQSGLMWQGVKRFQVEYFLVGPLK